MLKTAASSLGLRILSQGTTGIISPTQTCDPGFPSSGYGSELKTNAATDPHDSSLTQHVSANFMLVFIVLGLRHWPLATVLKADRDRPMFVGTRPVAASGERGPRRFPRPKASWILARWRCVGRARWHTCGAQPAQLFCNMAENDIYIYI